MSHPLARALGDGLDRPLAFVDLETTGLSLQQDRIVELAVLILFPDGRSEERERRFNPEMPIPEEASAVHGITDSDVAHEAPFRQRARALADLLGPCDLAGFNIRRFDLPMLVAEFRRAGVEFDPRKRRLIDAQLLQRAVLDLADALLGDAEALAERIERAGLVDQAALAHDPQLALRQHGQRILQPGQAAVGVDAVADDLVLQRRRCRAAGPCARRRSRHPRRSGH